MDTKYRNYPCLMEHNGYPGLHPRVVKPGDPITLKEHWGDVDPAFKAALHYHRVVAGSEEEAALKAESRRGLDEIEANIAWMDTL